MPILTFIGALSTGKSNILRSLELFWNPEIFKQELELAEERAFYSSFQENKNDNIDIEGEWVFNLRSQKEFFGLFYGTEFYNFLEENNPKQLIIKLKFNPNENKTRPARFLGWTTNENYNKITWFVEDPYSKLLEDFHYTFGNRLIFKFRGDFPDVEKLLLSFQDKPEQLSYLESLFGRVLGEKIHFEFLESPNTSRKVIIDIGVNKSKLPYTFLSHSTKRLLAILTILTESNKPIIDELLGQKVFNPPKILLIDNPEVGEPKTQRKLADIFIEHAPPHQIILTTSSPRFMIGNVNLVKIRNSNSIVSPIESDSDIEEVVNLLGVRPSDSLSADAVVFVEGITDAAVLRVFQELVFQVYQSDPDHPKVRPPIIAFIPVGGWTKLSFTISVKVLKSR
jgi:predicted ATP-dependent endonuclease of OLD family